MASEREVLVEGFEERGGILKLKAQQQQDERLGYVPWEQMPAWFNAPGVSEQANLSNYLEVRALLTASKPPALLSTHDKMSDYERLKARAELHYLHRDYTACVGAWLAILGQYKIGTKGKPGGLRLEALDSLARCFLNLPLHRVSVEEADALVHDLKQSLGPHHEGVLLAIHGRLLQRANRFHAAIRPLQQLAVAHPADPGLWFDLAEAYRLAYSQGSEHGGVQAGNEDETGRRGLFPGLARKSIQLAVKMVRVCSNAQQCRVSLTRHQSLLRHIQHTLADHSAFYSPCPHDDACRQSSTVSDSEAAAELCLDELVAKMEAMSVQEHIPLEGHGLATDIEREWLMGDATATHKALQEAVKVVATVGIADMDG